MVFVKGSFWGFLLLSVMTLASCSNVTVETSDNFEGVELPDGSIVYLNHNSVITYEEEFDPRMIEIEGEVYFSVVKSSSPFIVKTNAGEVIVLGTEFNVKSEIDKIEVEVARGIVELKIEERVDQVKRGESAVYEKTEKEIRKAKAEFKFRSWLKELKKEFKKLGKEIKSTSKEIGKESKEAGKEIKEELNKLKQ
jgi:ferric-dicitrate binding protein FerR (iron transport regulator)